jgi:DNA-binding MarR family transcriptional regulator
VRLEEHVRALLELYPRIFFACHTRHRRDPASRRLLSAHQASILDHLDEVEPLTLAALAAHMGVTPSTMCIAVERLVRRGYVLRARDPRDRRRAALRLSPAGARVKEAQSVLEPARVRGMLAVLPPDERAAALAGLVVLARAAGEFMKSGPAKRMPGLERKKRKERKQRKGSARRG